MAFVSCGAFGQVKTKDGIWIDTAHNIERERITHFPQSEGGMYIQTKTDKGFLVSRLTPTKQRIPDFWVLTKSDSLNIKKIQDLIVFRGELKTLLNDLVGLWYNNFKIKGESEYEATIHTVDKVGKRIKSLSK